MNASRKGKPMAYQSVNPFNGKLLKKFDELTDAQFETKIAAATKCYETWRHKSYAERAVIVAKAASLMHDRVDELAHTMTLEMGKRIGEAKGEVQFSSDILAYYATNAERFLANVQLHPTLGQGHMESNQSASSSAWSLGTSPTINSRESRVRT
jgi:succinate-semialdehyde dehydrogenase / glutarate-semialdehyde dehydrogenase